MPVSVATIREAWAAATRVCAAAWALELERLREKNPGQGHRPPLAYREPKKMAVHLAVLLSGADYAAVGRVAGLHKDTVSSHCAELRRRMAEDGELEALSLALEEVAKPAFDAAVSAAEAQAGRRAHRATDPTPVLKPDLRRLVALASDEAPSSDQRASSDRNDNRGEKIMGRAA